MAKDEPDDGYLGDIDDLDDLGDTQETARLGRSSDDWTTPAASYPSASDPEAGGEGTVPSARAGDGSRKQKKSKPPKPPSTGSSQWAGRSMTTLRFLRTMILTALVLSGLAAVGNIAIHHLPRTTTNTYKYPNIQRILVAIDGDGSVNVHGTTGSDDVTIIATDKATLLQPVQRQIISSGGLLIISVHCPSTECSSVYDVAVPKTTDVTVTLDHSAEQAEITASDLDSPVNLYTGRGNITMVNLSANVHAVANGDVRGTGLGGQAIDVFAPIAKSVSLVVTGNPQLVRMTTGQPGQVSLTLPAGAYDIMCEPRERCPVTGGITQDPNSSKQIQVTVNPATTASITSGG